MKYNLMAKSKTKTVKKVVKSKRSRRALVGTHSPANRYARLLHNPDNGDHIFDIYDGERGETQKFVSTLTLNTLSTQTSGLVFFFGATGNFYAGSAANGASPLTISPTNVGAPGEAFLNANAFKSRCKALKLELMPSAASFSNITGDVAAGVTTINNFVSGTTTVNNFFDLAKAYGPLRRETVCSRWMPSGLDHTYAVYNQLPNEDHNGVFIAYRGWPAGIAISVRITYVVEYTVKNNIGIPPTGAVSIPIGHQHILGAMQQQDPHWHHSILDEVKRAGVGIAKDAGAFGRRMAREGMISVAEKFFKKEAPLLLTL